MKKEAESRGAELAPSSLTLGIESGRGVVSMSCSRLNLFQDVSSGFDFGQVDAASGGGAPFAGRERRRAN